MVYTEPQTRPPNRDATRPDNQAGSKQQEHKQAGSSSSRAAALRILPLPRARCVPSSCRLAVRCSCYVPSCCWFFFVVRSRRYVRSLICGTWPCVCAFLYVHCTWPYLTRHVARSCLGPFTAGGFCVRACTSRFRVVPCVASCCTSDFKWRF